MTKGKVKGQVVDINQTAESIVKSQQDDMAEAIGATESEVRK